MEKTKHLDKIANKYHETKDPYYKDLWYKLVKEFANGTNNFKRRTVSINSCHKAMMEHIHLLEPSAITCMDLCELLRLKLTGYVDSINLHIMNDNSGSLVGCMCR